LHSPRALPAAARFVERFKPIEMLFRFLDLDRR
jgi:hypothetical protein